MAKDIFQRNAARLNGVFTTDRATLLTGSGLGALVQSLQINYSQQISRLYEVGAGEGGSAAAPISSVYFVGGRTEGNMTVNRVVGPANTIRQFYQDYGDVCSPDDLVIKLRETNCFAGAGGGSSADMTYTARQAVLTQISIGVEARSMIMNESAALMFVALDVTD